jgi:D-alanyl-D-alanine carboxypeptidase/D-alanyl-D-alanine-endopeptidase (penicillin-binding protein 4)
MRLALAFFLAAVLITPLSAQEQQGAATLTELQQRLTAHVTDPKFDAAMWGVKIVSSTSGKVLFEHNASKLLSPASNSKLYTMALALDRLGPDYRIKTSLLAAAKPTRSGLLKGDLFIYGKPDCGWNFFPRRALRFGMGVGRYGILLRGRNLRAHHQ